MFSFTLFICFILFTIENQAQVYKNWFCNQGIVNCSSISVGYSQSSYHDDTSAIREAFWNACLIYAKNKQESISGGETFWATEIGMFAMGNDFKESYDTLSVKQYLKKFRILDTLIEGNLVAVLAGVSNCISDIKKVSCIMPSKIPEWVYIAPENSEYCYAVGVAPGYYYEKSSWVEAEKSARLKLASNASTYVESWQLMNKSSGQSIENSVLSVNISNVRVVSRWRDLKDDLYYVLMKMPKR